MDIFFPNRPFNFNFKRPFNQRDPSFQLGWEKEARADPVDYSWVTGGGGSSDGSLRVSLGTIVSTQTMEPQLLELKGASQLEKPSLGVTGEETEATKPGSLLSGGGSA